MGAERNWHMANIWESVAQVIPESEAVVFEDQRLTWKSYENQAASIAQVFVDHHLKPDAKVSIYSYNSIEYLVAQFAAFKARLCPINVNYRYLETELAHVINNSDSQAIVFQAAFAPRLEAIRDQLSNIKLFLEIDDGSGEHLKGAVAYEAMLEKTSPMPVIERFDEDIYMLYTGGTTGLPKAVMYDHKTFSKSLVTKAMALRGLPVPEFPDEIGPIIADLAAEGMLPRSIPACPLMHGTGMWVGVVIPHFLGGTAILFDNKRFDADAFLTLIEGEKGQEVVIVGDVFAKPIANALSAAKASGEPYDVSSLKMVNSSGVMFSSGAKKAILEHMDVIIFDSMGSTEGSIGISIASRATIDSDQTAKFQLSPTSRVFTEDGREIEPGSGQAGLLCNGGMVPIGYYKDKAKSAETFKVFDGVRYSVPGDYARLEADGTITLLGRGSSCINSGGEKIYPEEVEEAVKSHPAVYDCLVVAVPDDKFGECVAAMISMNSGETMDAKSIKAHVRQLLADYKAPRHYIVTPTVPRADNGKADYKSAREVCLQKLEVSAG
ncbi:AMP-binding protein [bacterium]|jgi:fatty-acyl-CoA synthase|nr:AMP-binding protein [Porticoccaceae bacterium]MDB9814644.1 AMP-binding protein [bacterium]MDC0003176.1 AMP-binding protein [Porticoccaceae bacterium]